MKAELKDYINNKINIIDSQLDTYLEYCSPHPQVIYDSMRYSMFAGGKRLRPILTLAACEAVSGDSKKALPVACAIEMIHTYSLIHDDLPAMDNDDFRRGKLTNHKAFSEAIAILAGDALLTKAFQIIAKTLDEQVESATVLKLIEEVSIAAGAEGMVGGQVADMEAEGKRISAEELEYIHTHKTGALLQVSIRAGAIVGGASQQQLQHISEFAAKIGLAFQIQDDILDLIGDQQKLGKKVGSDLINDKATYPVLFGLERSKETVVELTKEALHALGRADCRQPKHLIDIAEYLVSRES